MGTGNAGKVTGSLWRRCSEPHTTENESGPIRFEIEMGTPICVRRLKVYLNVTENITKQQLYEDFIWNQIVFEDIRCNFILWVFWPVVMYILKFVQYGNQACWEV